MKDDVVIVRNKLEVKPVSDLNRFINFNVSKTIIWYHAIVANVELWKAWLNGRMDLSDVALRDLVLQGTVFGGLFQQSVGVDEWKDVSFHAIESDIFSKLGELEPLFLDAGFCRLVRNATSDDRELTRDTYREESEIVMTTLA